MLVVVGMLEAVAEGVERVDVALAIIVTLGTRATVGGRGDERWKKFFPGPIARPAKMRDMPKIASSADQSQEMYLRDTRDDSGADFDAIAVATRG